MHRWSARALVALAGLLLLLPARADVVLKGVEFHADDTALRLQNDSLELTFDAGTGVLMRVVDRTAELPVLQAPEPAAGLDWLVDGRWHFPADGGGGPQWRLTRRSARAEGDAALLEIEAESGGWTGVQTYRLWPGQPWVRREVALTPPADAQGTLSGVRFLLDGLGIAPLESCWYSVLSNFPPTNVLFANLVPGRTVGEPFGYATSRFVAIHNTTAQRTVLAALYSETEGGSATVREHEASVEVIHDLQVLAPVVPGHTIACGSQLLAVVAGPWPQALQAAQTAYPLAGFEGPPAATRDLAARAVIYSAHPGGTIDSGFQDTGGCANLARLFPYLADLGINTVWLLPFWKGSIYAPEDYYRLDERFATVPDLQALVAEAHRHDIRVLLDLIPHGPLDSSGLQNEHPDWVSRHEDGSLMYWWGCLACDYAHPGWQTFMGEVAAHWVHEAGVDGYRVDCAGGGPANYRPYDDNRPSMSGLYGGLGVLRAAREHMAAVKPDVLLLAEAAGPPLYRSADLTYDWPLCLSTLPDLVGRDPAVWVPQLQEWLAREAATFPPGARLMRFLENHDTVRAQMRYGVDLQRALMALFTVTPGVPLVYQEQEVGYAPFLRQLFRYRAEHDEMTLGSADFGAVRSDQPAVFTVLRSLGDRHTIAAVSFSPEPLEITLSIPAEAVGATEERAVSLEDALSGRRLEHDGSPAFRPADLEQVRLPLGPYTPALIEVSPAASESRPLAAPTTAATAPAGDRAPALQVAAAGHRPAVIERAEGLVIANGIYWLTIGRESGGFIRELILHATGQPLIQGTRLTDEGRHLWLGGDVSVGPASLAELSARTEGERVIVTARGHVDRQADTERAVALRYEVTYATDAGPQIEVELRLTPEVAVPNVLGAFEEALDLGRPSHWFVNTAEGLLWDDYVVRHPCDVQSYARYVHGWGARLWQSRLLPLNPSTPLVGAAWPDGEYVAVTAFRPPAPGDLSSAHLKERDGDREALTCVLGWLDGTRAATLEPGQPIEMGYRLTVGQAPDRDAEAAIRALAYAAQPRQVPSLQTEGACYVVRNPFYTLRLIRSHGGAIGGLTCNATGRPMIGGSMVYSDYGLYPDYTDPSGNKQRTMAQSENDPEPEVLIAQEPGRLGLTFEGRFRDSSWGGLTATNPPTRYRLQYEADDSPRLHVSCAVRTDMTVPQAKAFLAQVLRVPQLTGWAATSADGVDRSTTPGNDRVWQSLQEGLPARPAMVVTDEAGGTFLTVANLRAQPPLQNWFVLQGGGGSGALFFAFLDGQPADVQPTWRTLSFDLVTGAGGLDAGLAAAEVQPR